MTKTTDQQPSIIQKEINFQKKKMRLQVVSFRKKQIIHHFFNKKSKVKYDLWEKRSKNYKGPHAIIRINAVWLRFSYDKSLLSWLQTLLLFKSLKCLWFAEAKWKQLFSSTSHSKNCLFISITCIIPSLNCNAVCLAHYVTIL